MALEMQLKIGVGSESKLVVVLIHGDFFSVSKKGKGRILFAFDSF